MITKKTPENPKIFICEKCNFKTSKQSEFDRHILTAKHKNAINGNKKTPKNATLYCCQCGKLYKFIFGLSRHKNSCSIINNSITVQ